MALHFVLKVNNETIGHFGAQRTCGTDDADSVNTYSFEVLTNKPRVTRYSGTVSHRYGDGAWALVREAIEQMERAQS